ncbi:MAG: AAA family ATPase [Actinobacteria bacterium]|nr:AAA family ATPase [Actinomycetota bacterium]
MDAERALLTSIAIFGRGLDEAVAAGFEPDALLHDDCRNALKFIVAHREQFGELPSLRFVLDSVQLGTESVDEPLPVLISAWQDAYVRRQTIEFIREQLAPATNDPTKHLAEMLISKGEELAKFTDGNQQLTVTSAADIEPTVVEWFWEAEGVGWIPYDALSVLVGDPGEGKGLFGTWLSAYAIARGVRVGVLSHEDSKGEQVGRLEVAGADLNLVVFIDKNGAPLSFPSDVGLLRQAVEKNSLGLVIIDPINSFMDDRIKSSDDKEVRKALSPLAQVAQDLRCMILVVHHLSKSSVGQKLLYRSGGAAAYNSVARSAIALGKKNVDEDDDEDESNAHYIFQSKSNYSKATNVPLRFNIEEREIEVKTRAGLPAVKKVPAFVFEGAAVDVDQLDVFSPPRSRGGQKDDSIRKWMETYLEDRQTVVPDEMRDAMSAAGFPDSKWRSVRNIVHEELQWTAVRLEGQGRNQYEWRAPLGHRRSPFLRVIEGEVIDEYDVVDEG